MPSDFCPRGHPTPTAADRTTQGHCRTCYRQANRDLRTRKRAVLDTVRAFESIGVRFQNDGQSVSAAQVAEQIIRLDAAGELDSL